jgi:hypothetical protein
LTDFTFHVVAAIVNIPLHVNANYAKLCLANSARAVDIIALASPKLNSIKCRLPKIDVGAPLAIVYLIKLARMECGAEG